MPKSLILLYSICLFILISCASETEQKGLTEIVNLYGGTATISKGASTSTSEGSKRYIEINIENSEVLNSDSTKNVEMYFLNSIYLLYANQTKEERENYDSYQLEVENNGRTFTFDASNKTLAAIHKNIEAVVYTVNMIEEKKFMEARKYFHPKMKGLSEDFLRNSMKSIDSVAALNNSREKIEKPFIIGIEIVNGKTEIETEKTDYFKFYIRQNYKKGYRTHKVLVYPKTKENIINIDWEFMAD